jgi:SAM-dependent methyltransferase
MPGPMPLAAGSIRDRARRIASGVRHPRRAFRRPSWRLDLAASVVEGRPLSTTYGFDRGRPVDRYYIEDFVRRFGGAPGYAAGCIQGRVLEIGGRWYVDRFGVWTTEPAPGKVHRVDVLHVDASNPEATIVGSLANPDTLPADAFDCIICTQTLHVIYDVETAVRMLHRALRPGGTVLVTVPGITASCRPDRDHWGDWWRFTEGSSRRLFAGVFGAAEVHVEAYGNLTAAVAMLVGMAAEELPEHRLHLRDRDYDVLIGIRAVK